MDKIEKLMHIKTDKNQHVSPDTVFEMCCKINEITDILNSRLFEPIITVHNQSQKQPEGETIQNYNPEKGWDRYKKSKIEVKEFNLVPKVKSEKQEEWKEGLDNIDLMLAMLQSIENCTDEAVRNTAKAIREELDKVSQLLSESKEKAKIEVLEKVLEKKTNYSIEREEHGYRVTLEYVLADDIKKEIKLLKERK